MIFDVLRTLSTEVGKGMVIFAGSQFYDFFFFNFLFPSPLSYFPWYLAFEISILSLQYLEFDSPQNCVHLWLLLIYINVYHEEIHLDSEKTYQFKNQNLGRNINSV